MLAEIIIFILSFIITTGVSLILYARWNYGTLEAMGLPVEKPHWLLGNTWNLMENYSYKEDIRKVKKLGPIYGHYEGRTPMVFIADPDAVYKLFFTEGDYLEKKSGALNDSVFDQMLEFLNGEKWKHVRTMLSPVLSTGKIKTISQTTQQISESYVKLLKDKIDENGRVSKIDLHEFAAPYGIEVIASSLCGIKVENATDPNNQFVKELREAMFDNFKPHWSMPYLLSFKFLLTLFPIINPAITANFKRYVTNVLDTRQKSGVEQKDTVNVLLEMRNMVSSPEFKRLGIDEDTMFGQAMEFFIASYFGVITVSKKLFYYLVSDPQIYEKVREEMDKVLEKHDGVISYDSVVEMEYLSAAVNESLRRCIGFTRIERRFAKDWSCGDGIRIPKGTEAAFPLYAIHHNPEIYPQPEKFKPERFLPENKKSIPPGSFLGFGAGPRQCLGPRVAHQFIKIFIVSILKEFKPEGRKDTVLKEDKGGHFVVTHEPIYLDFVKI